ncbi:MAG: copper chaperone [Pseudomonadota bacterium]|nr:copper chaperone [Pseudomonadota bacterium]
MYILTIPALHDDKAVQHVIGAVLALDGTATFEFDIPERKLSLDTVAELEDVRHALDVAGYPVESVDEKSA